MCHARCDVSVDANIGVDGYVFMSHMSVSHVHCDVMMHGDCDIS
jgi:hypothetical protein